MTTGQELYEMEKGSIVSLYNQDFVVEQVVKLHKGSCNYLLKDGAAVKWLCVRNHGAVVPVLCDQVTLTDESFSETLRHGGVDYRLLAQGNARAVATSAAGYPRFVSIDYYDYSAGNDRHFLFIMQTGGEVTALAGESVISSAIMVFPKPN
jgi:hypothetical protein